MARILSKGVRPSAAPAVGAWGCADGAAAAAAGAPTDARSMRALSAKPGVVMASTLSSCGLYRSGCSGGSGGGFGAVRPS